MIIIRLIVGLILIVLFVMAYLAGLSVFISVLIISFLCAGIIKLLRYLRTKILYTNMDTYLSG